MAARTHYSLILTLVITAVLILSGCSHASPSAPVGHASAVDPAGDVRPFSDAQTPRNPAVVDLRAADIVSDGKILNVKLTTAAPIPQKWPVPADSNGQITHLLFGIFLTIPDGGGASVGVELTKDGWHGLGLSDYGKLPRSLDPPRISDNVITFKIPLDGTTRLTEGFTWGAFAACSFGGGDSDSYGDQLPGVFTSTEMGGETLPFPN
jgi:hypothetical protein